MTRENRSCGRRRGRTRRATGMQFSEVLMPSGWRILVEGEEPVVSFLRAESEADCGIEGNPRASGA